MLRRTELSNNCELPEVLLYLLQLLTQLALEGGKIGEKKLSGLANLYPVFVLGCVSVQVRGCSWAGEGVEGPVKLRYCVKYPAAEAGGSKVQILSSGIILERGNCSQDHRGGKHVMRYFSLYPFSSKECLSVA